jgi:hypothetical protein
MCCRLAATELLYKGGKKDDMCGWVLFACVVLGLVYEQHQCKVPFLVAKGPGVRTTRQHANGNKAEDDTCEWIVFA